MPTQKTGGLYKINCRQGVLRAGETADAAGTEDADVDEDEGESDHGCGGDPGDGVERACIHEVTHEVAAIYQQEDEYQHDGKPDTVTYLRKDEDFLERGTGNQDDGSADNNHAGVKAVENRSIVKLVID